MMMSSTGLKDISNVIQLKRGWLRILKIGLGLVPRDEQSRTDIHVELFSVSRGETDRNVCPTYTACATATSRAVEFFSSPEVRMSSCNSPCLSVTIVGLK